MASNRIEPGLLRVFQWFVGVRLGLLVLQLLSQRNAAPDASFAEPLPGVVVYGLLMAWLLSDRIRRTVGELWLPVALGAAAVSPIFENAIVVAGRLEGNEPLEAVLADYWLLFIVILVPLILVAWQYRFRYVLLYAVGTTVLDAAQLAAQLNDAGIVLAEDRNSATLATALIVGRGLLFAFVGYFITRIIDTQRTQRQQLARHAATAEQLATTRERARLARELHDTLAHSLSAVAVQLEGVRSLWDDDPQRARTLLDSSLDGARSGLTEARRAIQALRASPLEELGLAGALENLGTHLSETTAVEVSIAVAADAEGLAPDLEQAVYRIADEALTNVVRHAEAGHVHLRLAEGSGGLLLEVSDDGSGFDAESALNEARHGIQGMRERAAIVGGVLTVDSTPGAGTTIRMEVTP